MKNKKLISIVTPCYNEQENVLEHFKRVTRVISPLKNRYNFEFVYTDNSSVDKTFELLKELAAKHKNLKIIKFSRNIGANKAIFIGLSYARGDAAVVLQADLQDPPELIDQFIKWWQKGFDVVYGKINKRNENLFTRTVRNWYYRLISVLSEVDLPQNAGEFRLMSRRVLDAVSQYLEDDIYLRGVIAHVGFKQKAIPYSRAKRLRGRSSMNFLSLSAYAINGFLSTSVAPLRLALFVGLFFSFVGFLLTVYIIGAKIIFPHLAPKGFTTLGTIVTFFAGVQLLAIGIIGEYIRKIYIQSLGRPRGFVEKKINL